MTDNRTIHMGSGNDSEPIEENCIQGNYYAEQQQSLAEQQQSLAEAAAKIQALLEQLSKNYPPDTDKGKIKLATEVIKGIESNPTLMKRILSALKAGGISALEQALNHPAASFVIGALEDWQKKELAIASEPAVKSQPEEQTRECKEKKITELEVPPSSTRKTEEKSNPESPKEHKYGGFWQFSRQEVKLIGFMLFLSLLYPLQDVLLESRLFVQARYRKITDQIPSQVESPLLLVQIDNNSLNKDNVQLRYSIDYSYLGKLVDKASNLGAKVVGIDYVLDQDKEQPENSQKLAKTIRQAQENQPETRFVFAAINSEDSTKGNVSEDIVTIDSEHYHKGNIDFLQWYVELPDDSTKPFAHQLALNYSCLVDESSDVNGLQLNQKSANNCDIASANNDLTRFVFPLKLQPIYHFIQWFHPIIDFSIPPDKAYQTFSACEFLETCATQHPIPKSLKSNIVLIAPGGYEEAGVKQEGEDNYPTPLAINFWRGLSDEKFPKDFPGGEAHAYMIHHFLTKRLVIPIPDFLMVLLAVLPGKGIFLILLNKPRKQKYWLMGLGGATAVYIWVCLQVYIFAGVLIPLLLPSAVFWNYVRFSLRRKSHG